jgi:flavin-dependent dehydrogenase
MAAKYDVVVVGAGPAGLMAARTAKRDGLKVLLVEQKKEITRIRRSCAEALATAPGYNGETVTVEGEKIIFHISDFSMNYHGCWLDIKEFFHMSPNGSKIIIERDETPVGKVFDKEILLQELLAEVEASGCEIENQTMGVKADNTNGEVVLTLQSKGKEKEVRSRIAIAADGINSRIVQSLGLNKNRKFYGTPRLMTCILEGVDSPYPNAFMLLMRKGRTNGFYPKVTRKAGDPPLFQISGPSEEGIKRFLTKGNFSSWFKKAKVVGKRSAVLNFHTPILDPVAGNVIIAGDAAAFIEVFVQGALVYGFRAAKAAAKEIERGNGFAEYVDYWKRSFGYNKLETMESSCRIALGLMGMEDEELNYLFALLEPQKIKAYYDEFEYPVSIMSRIMGHLDRIRREQPDLARKVDILAKANMDEIINIGIKGYMGDRSQSSERRVENH